MTESVARHGAAPAKGNENALNQIRTNEVALAFPWELREFRLCHTGDTATPFFHVDPTAMPATLSNFLTGGGTGGTLWSVADTQFGAPPAGPPRWTFSDLDDRFERLYTIACDLCASRTGSLPGFLDLVAELNLVVPIDPIDPVIRFPFEIGPVESLDVVARLFEVRAEFAQKELIDDVTLDGALRAVETHVH
jgi:hypothetical protein